MRYAIAMLCLLGWAQGACTGSSAARVIGDPTADTWSATLPVLVSAGADREVLAGARACLNSTGSYDPLGKAFTVSWTQTAGPSVYLSNVADPLPCFVAPLQEGP